MFCCLMQGRVNHWVGGAEGPGPEQGGGPWLAVGRLTEALIAKATTPRIGAIT